MTIQVKIGDWLAWTTEKKVYWYEIRDIVENCPEHHNKAGILIYVSGIPIWHEYDGIIKNKKIIKATTKEKLAYNLKTNLIVYDNMD